MQMKKKGRIKNNLLTNNLRTISKSFPRFISLMLMSALGVFVFAGLTATAPDMVETLDQYLDAGHGYDVRVVSDSGLTEDDITAIEALDEVEDAEGIHSGDVAITATENQFVLRIASLTGKIYRPELLDGRMPEAADEIVVEDNLLTKENLKLGDKLEIDSDTFYEKELTIVGTVKSALYYKCVDNHQEHGKTNVGTGTVNYYGFMTADAYDQDYYTAIYGMAVGAEALVTDSDEYLAVSDKAVEALEGIADAREDARYQQLKQEGQEKIDEAREKADKKLGEAEDKLKDAKEELDDAKKKLKDGKKELKDAKKELEDGKQKIADGEKKISDGEKKLADAKAKIPSAESEISSKEKQLQSAKSQIDSGEAKLAKVKAKLDSASSDLSKAQDQLDAAKDKLDEGKRALDTGEIQIQNGEAELEAAKNKIASAKSALAAKKAQLKAQGVKSNVIAQLTLDAQQEIENAEANYSQAQAELKSKKSTYESNKKNYESQKSVYESKKKTYDKQLSAYNKSKSEYDKAYDEFAPKKREYQSAVSALEDAKSQLASAKSEISSKESELAQAKADLKKAKADYEQGQKDYAEGQKTYEENEKLYEENLVKYNDAEDEYRKEKKKADRKIERAEKKLRDLKETNWTVYDRKDDSTYNDYIQDAQSIENLALIFPVVFFMVAILVSLISMNRMVEDDRLEIGTLKSLGFSNRHIRRKYIIFSLTATLVGGLLGAVGGLYIIPTMIFNIYRILFSVPGPVLMVHPTTTLLGFALAILCVCGTSILTANMVLKERPSELMRPKAPKNGRRILLERIPGLWRSLSFSNKITIRNLFRYKKRVLITIGGIIGCTALMLTGFGIRDSIVDLPTQQFGEVFVYDGTVYLYDLEIGEEETRIAEIMDQPEIESYTAYQQLRFTSGDCEGYLIAVKDQKSLDSIIKMVDLDNGNRLQLPTASGEVVISDKLAQRLNLKVGDEFTCQDLDQNTFHVRVGAVCVNYVENYIFMNAATLDEVIPYAPNQACFNSTDMTKEEQDALAERMLKEDEVLNVSYIENLVESVSNMLKSLNSVVLILVVLSAVLSFVVLYNLANININERKREIATLKVLGFYDKEVDRYITKETIFMTLVGIAFGLLLGTVLSRIVVSTIEVDMARFINEIKPVSYAYAAAFSVFFTWIVNRITHFALKRINMIDSLKSVE